MMQRDIGGYNTTLIRETNEKNKNVKIIRTEVRIGNHQILDIKDEDGKYIWNRGDKVGRRFFTKNYYMMTH